MNAKKQKLEFERHLAILGHDFFALLAGRSELVNGRIWRVPESSPHKKWEWMEKEKLQEHIELYQRLGWTTRISLNDMEPGHMTIDHVRRVSVILFNIDAPRSDETRPADEEERLAAKIEAEILQKYIEKEYHARCFLACSGNGFPLYCPILPVTLPTARASWQFNAQLKCWMKRVRDKSSVAFDVNWGINQLVRPIGFRNLNIPHAPLETYWLDNVPIDEIDEIRKSNTQLRNAVIKCSVEEKNNEDNTSIRTSHEHTSESWRSATSLHGDLSRCYSRSASNMMEEEKIKEISQDLFVYNNLFSSVFHHSSKRRGIEQGFSPVEARFAEYIDSIEARAEVMPHD